ncbi:aldo-keto reductase [Acrasis kona]|uniref:Aldo-keto reductase n=1 Tax=Acrasis kona TaxID=1008807 RepID=A0AAW2Z292_9EUKA
MVEKKRLGSTDVYVSEQGLGCMGMSSSYSISQLNDEESLKVLTRAADLGITFWDTSDVYGPFTNEKLIGRWFKENGRRSEIFLCTKFAILLNSDGSLGLRGDPEYVKSSCNASLERLGVEYIDLYYQHRVDPLVPIEKTVEAMVELIKEGKVKHLGLSECSADTLRRAHKIHPIAAVQMEYSPFALEIESEQTKLLDTCRELGVSIVAYSPLGRGMLTGAIRSRADFEPTDFRSWAPRFSEGNFELNLKLVDGIEAIAKKRGCTPGQATLAWIAAQGNGVNIFPVPGTKRVKYLEENASATKIKLSEEEKSEIRKLSEATEVRGERYPGMLMDACFADSPPLQ